MNARANRASYAIKSLLDARNEFVERLNKARAKGAILQLANDLIGYPIVSVADVQHLYGIAYPTANNIVAKMVSLGILKEVTGREYGRILRCPAVYEVIARG